MEKKEENRKEIGVGDVWNCGSSLYDAYELVSVAYTIEKNITSAAENAINTRKKKEKKKKKGIKSRLLSCLSARVCCMKR